MRLQLQQTGLGLILSLSTILVIGLGTTITGPNLGLFLALGLFFGIPLRMKLITRMQQSARLPKNPSYYLSQNFSYMWSSRMDNFTCILGKSYTFNVLWSECPFTTDIITGMETSSNTVMWKSFIFR